MEKDPPPLCYARPREDNILEWYVERLTQALYPPGAARHAVRRGGVLGPAALSGRLPVQAAVRSIADAGASRCRRRAAASSRTPRSAR